MAILLTLKQMIDIVGLPSPSHHHRGGRAGGWGTQDHQASHWGKEAGGGLPYHGLQQNLVLNVAGWIPAQDEASRVSILLVLKVARL